MPADIWWKLNTQLKGLLKIENVRQFWLEKNVKFHRKIVKLVVQKCKMLDHILVISFICFVHHYYSDSKYYITFYPLYPLETHFSLSRNGWDCLWFCEEREDSWTGTQPPNVRDFSSELLIIYFSVIINFLPSTGFEPPTSRSSSQCWTTKQHRPPLMECV